MESIYKLVQIFVSVFEIYLVFDFFSSFFPLRKILRNKYAQTGIVFGLSLCVCIVNSFGSSSLNLVSMLVIYLLLVLLAFEGDLLKKILYYIMVHAIMIGSEFLFIVLVALPSDFSLNHRQTYSFSMLISLISVKVLAFILFNIVKRIPKSSNKKMGIKNLLLYSIVPISMLSILIATAYLNVDFDSLGAAKFLLIISCIIGMFGNALIFYVFDRYSLSLDKLRQQDLMIAKLEMEEKYYEQIENINREHAALLHDVHHYLRTIGEVAAENKDEDIMKIISELQGRVSAEQNVTYCGNRLVNAILNEKRKTAKEAEVEMELKIENGFFISQIMDIDLIAIMGNLLDNAIEAAAQCKKGFIKVYMFMQNENHYSVMKVQNNFRGEIILHNETIITSKNDKKRHGIGLQSVTNVIERYGGNFQVFYEEHIFTAIVLLPMMSKEEMQKLRKK